MFLNPEVVDCSSVELKWSEPDEDGLVQFMCDEKQFRCVDPREEIIMVVNDAPVKHGDVYLYILVQ